MRRPAAARALFAVTLTGVLALTACTPPRGADTDATADPTTAETSTPEATPSEEGTATDDSTDDATPATDPTSSDEVFESVRGLPEGVTEGPAETQGGVGWNETGDELYVITYGSSTCPLVPVAVRQADAMVEIDLAQAGGAVCTMDFVPTTTIVQGPAELDPLQAVTARLGDLGQVTVPNATTPPAIGWLATPAG